MDYRVSFEVDQDLLIFQVSGERTYEAVVEIAREVFDVGKDQQLGKLLIDVRELAGWLRIMDSYRVVTGEFPKYQGQGIERAAIVDRPRPGGMYWFLETVARNRGFNLRIFEDMQQAKSWLRSDLVGEQELA